MLYFILGGILLLLQIASLVFDLVQTGGLKFDTAGGMDGLMYNISYLSAGLVGIIIIALGIFTKEKDSVDD